VKLMNFNDQDNFVTSACWMDEIRRDGFSLLNNWHFINSV